MKIKISEEISAAFSKFTHFESVEFALWCAKRAFKVWEQHFPDDGTKEAIESLQNWVDNPTILRQRLAKISSDKSTKTALAANWYSLAGEVTLTAFLAADACADRKSVV